MTKTELGEAAQKVRTTDEAVALLWPLIEAELTERGIDVNNNNAYEPSVGAITMYKSLFLSSWASAAIEDSICDKRGVQAIGDSLFWKIGGQVKDIIRIIKEFEED